MMEPEYRLHGWPRQPPDQPAASNSSGEPKPAPHEGRIGRRRTLPLLSRLTGWARGLLSR